MKKSSVETYDKKQVFDLFLKGANIMVKLRRVNEEEECFSFS